MSDREAESSLYVPVRDFLIAQQFRVHAEAHHCDVVGERNGELVIVELKRALTLELLAQGVERQKLSDTVYVAVPKPEGNPAFQRIRALFPVLKKLELGLLVVDGPSRAVDVWVQPMPYSRRRKPRARRALLTELAGRTGDDNLGGSTRVKIVTAYRENAIHLAVALQRFGPMKPRDLRAMGTGPKTLAILSGNVYGWFERLDRGIYGLTEKGASGLTQWPALAERKAALLPERDPSGG